MRKSCFIFSMLVIGIAVAQKGNAQSTLIAALKSSHPYVVLQDGSIAASVKADCKWAGDFCRITLHNEGQTPVRISEVVLIQAAKLFTPGTPFYAEGFQMLSQYKGTLEAPGLVGSYDDSKHYRLPQPDGYKTVYNMLVLDAATQNKILMGFTSSFRFVGKFQLSADTVKAVMDLENTLLQPAASLSLEEFSIMQGSNENGMKATFAKRISHFHPQLKSRHVPAGWCSWYCFGPDVTAQNIRDNLSYIKQHVPQLKYIQLDDGYQPHMGDWLETGSYFGGSIKTVLKEIKAAGLEPAIWVAPFICDSNSRIFKEHPDWLVKDSSGRPLRSDKVGFGGWRLAPWYVLDGTNPAVQQHLTHVFKTMSQDWGCTYFKLDANYWGAIHGGVYFDKTATRVTAYRNGMKAVLKGAGSAFILGCNHPLWPSLGLINGSRSSNDIYRDWNAFVKTGEENIHRIWQNGTLWWNDPDCILLTGKLSEPEFMYHASLLFSTGGLMLSGDDLTTISEERLAVLKKMVPPTGGQTTFNDAQDEGWMKTPGATYLILLNKEETAKEFSIPLQKRYRVTDYWTGEKLGTFKGSFKPRPLPPHSGTVYRLTPIGM